MIICEGIYYQTLLMKKTISPLHQKRLSELGIYLRELRFNENMTQAEVCEELNLHHNTLTRIENGCNFEITTLLLIADFYEVDASTLLSIWD